MKLQVIDLFCGPGGFSAGFEAAGFEVVAALDYDKDAVSTYSANHRIEARLQDLTDFDYSELPDADVVIGGPPCTQFSLAKSNKTRNILHGLLLVQSFLRCVHTKKPKYWVMENVPTIQKYLPSRIPLKWIGIDEDGDMEIPTRVELVAADYGVPQKRRRYLIGNFPVPPATHYDPNGKDIFNPTGAEEWRTMGNVLSHLPDPLQTRRSGKVEDPNYGFRLPANELSDHFYDARFNSIEQRSIHQAKTQHPYMGKLAWPDKIDRPARTVVGTQLGRETLVLPAGNGEFRRATVRECASFQSFPISYQFFGRSYSSKYRQAGDAVPPKLSFALAKAIARSEGVSITEPAMKTSVCKMANAIPTEKLRKKRKPNFKRKANFLLPSKEVRGTRCELFVANFSECTVELNGHSFQAPIWQADLVLGEGANNTQRFHLTDEVYTKLEAHLLSDQRISSSIVTILERWRALLVDYNEGSEVYAHFILEREDKSPLALVEKAKELVDCHLPASVHHNLHVDCQHIFDHPKGHRLKSRVLVGCLMAYSATEAWQKRQVGVSALLSS